jgi:hypothetical protein
MAVIVPMILDALKGHLQTEMIDNVSSSDLSRATEVKIGRFQDDPLRSNVYIAISPGDPSKSGDWEDGIVTLESMQDVGFNIDPREVGGGETWWRRGVAQIGVFYINERLDEEDAVLNAYNTLHRLLWALRNAPVGGLTDEYNEKSVKMFVAAHQFSESGGPPDQYIWRGKVWWQVLTEQP